ncbi:helix-turn-helix domain-containing protein [Bradyrhizobium sp. STM 3809]|uniref:helix-turn-helix domain-containing protein n=1 Tax=Bradyrhizobium sp. STM 3809 TaxID=551936 RepID=UPI0014794A6B|nr:helix-turn-helix domain-containing protein [Bradyrhizobium sp. STM 3809]
MLSLTVPASNRANQTRPRREKCFGDGRPQPLDRNGKVRVMTRARALMRRAETGKHYGAITAKAFAVLEVLVWGFHNARSGVCIPSYETIAERAGCARSTVAEAIRMLEDAGLVSWVHRVVRVRDWGPDLFGRAMNRLRVIRTSNSYFFRDPGVAVCRPDIGKSSKSEIPLGTSIQDSISKPRMVDVSSLDPDFLIALGKLGKAVRESGAR